MRLTALGLILVASQLAVAADDADTQKQLTGTWKGQVENGATGHEITFADGVVSGTKDGTRDLGKGAFKLDLTSEPYRLDATEIKAGGEAGKPYFGIFTLEGDSLTWCVGTKEVPTTFETGNGQFKLVLKRQAAGTDTQKQLTGTWKGRVENGATGHEITFADGVVSGTKDGTRDLGKGAFKLDLTSEPYRLDATEIKADGAAGKPYFGIFTLEGDSLTWCVGTKEVPTKFETGNGQFKLVLQRQAGAATTPAATVKSTDATKYQVAELKEPAPEKLSANVRETLGTSGLRISAAGGDAVCDIWLRTGVPVLSASSDLGNRKYPLESGTLVGALRISKKSASDFRDFKLAAGVYTLRYALQPTDGAHEATGQFRDFLVLVSATDDADVARISDAEALGDLGIKASGESHPAILHLSPPKPGRETSPAIVYADGSGAHSGLAILVAKTSATGNEAVKELPLEIVVAGIAKE